jgi:hypothetical protein
MAFLQDPCFRKSISFAPKITGKYYYFYFLYFVPLTLLKTLRWFNF